MDKGVIDLAEMGILENVFHKRDIHKLKQEAGIVFLFDHAGELLYIECVTSHLDAAIYKYQQEMEFIGMIRLEGSASSLEAIKKMLTLAYHPKASHSHPVIRTIHSGCIGRISSNQMDQNEQDVSTIEKEVVHRLHEAFMDSDGAAHKLNISVDTLFFYCQHLIYSGYSFRKDSHRRYVFLEEDIDLLQVFINLLEREVPLKRAAKEAVKLTNKFGVKEALRLSKFSAGRAY
ncbi:MAG TPA: hypothetical protein VNM45_21780 [Bacillus sp. (in: firmicutes)]|nr:hypothetical protein [Bacillus sp. (in: firmicutes)]